MRVEEQWATLVARHKFLMLRNPDAEFSRVDPLMLKAIEKKNPSLLGNCEGNFFKLDPETYCHTQTLMVEFEKVHRDILMRKFDQTGVCIKEDEESLEQGELLFYYKLRGLSKGHPKLCLGDLIILDDEQNKPEHFVIQKIVGDVVKFSRLKPTSRKITDVPCNMSFHSLAVPSKRCTKNLRQIQRQELRGFLQIRQMLFVGKKYKEVQGPNWVPVQQVPITDELDTRTDYVDDRLKKCNERQRQAIINIMEAKCRPSLYILFGPPGTGKTATLIETVGQIYQRNLKVRILLCAQSNNCVDDLVDKLIRINIVKISDLIRLCSLNYYCQLQDQFQDKQVQIPHFFTVKHFETDGKRVVITTNLMAPKLSQEFDYVLVDEASSANIPESLLSCSKLRENGCFVLAGDPKQLGPVVSSLEVAAEGLGKSLLEHMFGENSYGRHGGIYDQRFITKLVLSYRCDERLMQLNNKLFYENELEFRSKTPADILKKLNFDRPLVFKRVRGKAKRLDVNYSPSWRNDQEADECIEFLFKLYQIGLKPHQIGIITYYTLQKNVLMEKFEEKLAKYKAKLKAQSRGDDGKDRVKGPNHLIRLYNFTKKKWASFSNVKHSPTDFDWHCKIDTVDAFQGNERDVIIISTTITHVTPFLIDRKRFNVATSRARWLTVVVGHPEVLDSSTLWRKFAKLAYLP